MRVNKERLEQLKQNILEGKLQTPAYVLDETMLRSNLEKLKFVADKAGCDILLAQKAFSVYQTYPLIGEYLSGATASGLYEAKLGAKYMKKENHVFSPVYPKKELEELVTICDHIIFNSVKDWLRNREDCLRMAENEKKNGRYVSFGLRLNPCYSTQDHAIYDPCGFGSRFGVRKEVIDSIFQNNPDALEGIDGVHIHTLCEQNSDDLEATMEVVERDFAKLLSMVKWINLGGGHHITREDYDVKRLVGVVKHLKETYGARIYLEPGEAVVLDAGYMVADVLDVVENDAKTAILNASAACHMPDIIEMPYNPNGVVLKKTTSPAGDPEYIWNAHKELVGLEECGETTYRFGGNTCLAGDVFGSYVFEQEINRGDVVVFFDMALYSLVKNNTFIGMPLPSVLYMCDDGSIHTIRSFGYEDFENRL